MSTQYRALFAPLTTLTAATVILTAGCAGQNAASQNPGAAQYDGYYSENGSPSSNAGSGGDGGAQPSANDPNGPKPRKMTTTRGRSDRTSKARSLIAKRPVRDEDEPSKPTTKNPTPGDVTLTGFVPTLAPAGSVVTIFGTGLDQSGTLVQIGNKQQKIVEQAPDRLVIETTGSSGPVEVRARVLRTVKTARSETPFKALPKKGPFTAVRKNASHGLLGNVYELQGDVQELPDFGSLGQPVAVIAVPNLDVASTKATKGLADLDAYGVHFRGSLNVLEAGEYNLCLNAGDGAQLYLDQTLVVDNDGRHETTEVCEPLAVEAGEYELDLLYFQGEPGEMGLQLSWAKDGGAKKPIPTSALFPPTDAEALAMP